jgi:hypothetical protein
MEATQKLKLVFGLIKIINELVELGMYSVILSGH